MNTRKVLLLVAVCFNVLCCFGVSFYGDSVIVVKGQVSSYYISVTKERIVEGIVSDLNKKPLFGATVMPINSPAHCNTSVDGRFSVKVGPQDSILFIYYPGMRYCFVPVPKESKPISVTLLPSASRVQEKRGRALATRWYNPYSYAPSSFCNPTNISYNFEPYNSNVAANGSFRSAADPMVVTYKGEFFLFSTNQGGFHRSTDLARWDFVPASFQRRPTDDDQCAPAAFVSGDTLFYTGSTYSGLPVWYSTKPTSGRFKRAVEQNDLPTWDPCLFLDDDGKLFVYYGSSNEYALKGVELDRVLFKPKGRIVDIMKLHPSVHGWERFGMNNDDSTTLAPFTEGAYMTKHNGRYYFQYGAPGTEFKVYADGVYVSDNPLGPFTYQKHNPMCYKPGGYVQGAGHGGTFNDFKGNYWHVATCMLSLKYKFERRIGIYPVSFDTDGVMYASTAFGDYPSFIPAHRKQGTPDAFVGWMLLSYGKQMAASSSDGMHTPNLASDESMRTFWAASSTDSSAWISMDLGSIMEVRAVQVNFYDHKALQHNRAMDIYHQYQLFHSVDGSSWELVVDKSDDDMDVPHDYVELAAPLQTRYLKLVNVHAASGVLAISDLRVFGLGPGKQPVCVDGFNVLRDKKDRRNAKLLWKKSSGAYGYNIYFGTDRRKLYSCITVLGANSYDFRGLDSDKTYFFAIEALGESGRSEKSDVIER